MMELITTPHLDVPDDFYEALIETHANLETAESHALNVLRQALQVARGGAQ